MNQLLESLQDTFRDEESRYAYVEGHLNASVAAQIKKFRGDMSQQELAEKVGTKQSGISRLENANYSSWKVDTLRKLARAFGLRLRISFEEFGTLIPEIENFKKGVLERRRFEDDPAFNEALQEPKPEATIAKTTSQRPIEAKADDDLSWLGNSSEVANQVAASHASSRARPWDAVSFPGGTTLREVAGVGHVENIGAQPLGEYRGIHLVPKPENQTAEAFNPSSGVSAQASNIPDAA